MAEIKITKDELSSELKNILTNNTIESVLSVEKWQGQIYSFEEEYPASKYDIEIEPGGSLCTKEDKKLFAKADLKGFADVNKYEALGDTPVSNINILLTVIKKVNN